MMCRAWAELLMHSCDVCKGVQGCAEAAASAAATSCQRLQRRAQCTTRKCRNHRGYVAARQRGSEERCAGRYWYSFSTYEYLKIYKQVECFLLKNKPRKQIIMQAQARGAAPARTFRRPRRGTQPRRRWPAPRATSRPPALSWRPPGCAAPETHATAFFDPETGRSTSAPGRGLHALNPKPACVELPPTRAAQLLMHARA